MLKLSDFVEMAAVEYWQVKSNNELDSIWVAEFFQEYGVLDDHPGQDLISFYALVKIALTRNIERVKNLVRIRQNNLNQRLITNFFLDCSKNLHRY